MKKIVVMSDNHGFHSMLSYVKDREAGADYYIHCGDSEAPQKDLLKGYICVKGNNDWYLDLPDHACIHVENVGIYIVHGHRFGYFNREIAMRDTLIKNKCQLLLCGHTHVPMFVRDGDMTYVNPGSTTLPRGGSQKSYAVITIDENQVVNCEFKTIDE
jgi:phosphoesterase, MJ0936 family